MNYDKGGVGHGPKYGLFVFKNLSSLPQFNGRQDAEAMITFMCGLERAFGLRAMETGTSESTKAWGDYAIQRLTGKAAEWAHLTWPASHRVDWEDFKVKMAQQYIAADYLNKLKMAFAYLSWDSKKPLMEFNDAFKSLRLRLRIVNKEPLNQDSENSIHDNYVTKLEQAATKKKGSGPACMVYGAYTQWIVMQEGKPKPDLAQVMSFCCKMDNIHNRHTIINLDTSKNNSVSVVSGNQPLTTSKGGDAMDLNAINTRGGYNGRRGQWRGSYGRVLYRSGNGQRGGYNSGKEKESDKSGGAHQPQGPPNSCFHCHSPSHVKRDCPGHKKLLESHARRDAQARVTEVEEEEQESDAAKDKGDA
ncbi:MAG: hypothetical protein JWM47_4167 [Acidimicrobiales bacterium]|nr:hypothetical protein [Acidimicrobiales bacterium]